MYNNFRSAIKIGGESSQGINSVGKALAYTLKYSGFYTFGYREYPSIIEGGFASYQVDFSGVPINSSSKNIDLAICISRAAIHKMLPELNRNGVLIHSVIRFSLNKEEALLIQKNNIKVFYIDVFTIIKAINANRLVQNTILLGAAIKLLKVDIEFAQKALGKVLNVDKKVLDLNFTALQAGYEFAIDAEVIDLPASATKENPKDDFLMLGNNAIALGAVKAGVRAYYSYPMTPTSSILEFLADLEIETGMVVKQAEDEITAVQMALGTMHMGSRALVATSGGGFDLMTESLSMAAITEIPLVIVLGQRPGPATGLPTWTATGDLNLAVYSGHGEFVRCVVAISDIESAYYLIQKAFNIAETFQIPVIVLTDKQVNESMFQGNKFTAEIVIERGLINDSKTSERYQLTKSGISPRWLPGSSEKTFIANSDEHFFNGRLTEDETEVQLMVEKRMKKETGLLKVIPDPQLFGKRSGDVLLVSWGSPKNTILDFLNLVKGDSKLDFTYLHYEYLFPLKTELFEKLVKNFKRVVLIENNYFGQLGQLIKKETGYNFKEKVLKYNGRPFFLEDLLDYFNYGRTMERPKILK